MNYWYEKGRSYLFDGCLSHLTDKVRIIPTILDDVERKYLKGVIKPFRDKVKCIIKRKSFFVKDAEYISIELETQELKIQKCTKVWK